MTEGRDPVRTRDGGPTGRVRPLALAATLALILARPLLANPASVEPAASDGSGTAWLPESTAHAGHAAPRGPWDLMLHYNAFAGVTWQNAPDSLAEGFTTNWAMGMARYRSEGTLTLRGMLSVEAPFLGPEGYPLVLQTGETADDRPLVDRQHPHDLFMELAARYQRPFGAAGVDVYVAPVGEPSLGPPAFPHRPSAATDPMAPLGHHWQDSTHIAFGVATAGVYWKRVKLEGSIFNGREPDEDRYDFDFEPLDSYSARLSVNPSTNWSLQASFGYLTEPEELHPGTDVRRGTASIAHDRPLGNGSWSSTFIWGLNAPEGERSSAAFLAESSRTFGPHAVFGRAEYVQKSGEEFGFTGDDARARLPVGSVSLGYSHILAAFSGLEIALGGRGSVGFVEDDLLERRYGTARPVSGAIFLHLRPAAAALSSHHHHGV